MTAAHLKELLGLMLIGEGVVGVLYPEQHTRLWAIGPRPWREFVERCAQQSELLRLLWAAQTGVGIWLTARQLPPRRGPSRRRMTLAGSVLA